MPHKNPEDKKRWQEKWKEQGKEIGYNKWLYDRRKLRFDDAAEFRKALEKIARSSTFPIKSDEIARDALKASDRRHKKVGPSPRENGVPIESNSNGGDSLLEALVKLGLK